MMTIVVCAPQDSAVKGEASAKLEAPAVEEAIVIEEEELHLTLKKEESYGGRTPPRRKEGGPGEAPLAPLAPRPLRVAPWPEWRQIGGETEVHPPPVAQSSYPPHRRDQNKAAAALPDSSLESHGGRVGKVFPMCKRDRRSPELSADPFAEKGDYGAVRTEDPAQMAAYRKVAVMSPLAKKKLLSQVCESASFSSARPPLAPERDGAGGGERDGRRRHESDGAPEAAPMMLRPSVIQHAQSSRPPPPPAPPAGRILQPHVGAPWQPYLPRTQESASEKLLQARGFAGDCYSSPHLHSLYRQTENCLGQDELSGYADEAGRGFVRPAPEQEGPPYGSHYGDRARTGGEGEDEPRDLTVSKRLCRRASAFPEPSFCSLPYPIADSHPKACRVPPMTISPPKRDPSPPFPAGKSSSDPSLPVLVRPSKRSLGEAGGVDLPERKVRAVTPIQPAPAVRRGDPEELKAAEPARAAHLTDDPAGAYPLPQAAPLYAGMYPAGGLLSQHPGLQYLKSQSAVSPLVPPLAFHSMLLHRQLLASGPHHFFRHPGGAALYGDLLHHLYPLSTLPPPQLSSLHPSTRL